MKSIKELVLYEAIDKAIEILSTVKENDNV